MENPNYGEFDTLRSAGEWWGFKGVAVMRWRWSDQQWGVEFQRNRDYCG